MTIIIRQVNLLTLYLHNCFFLHITQPTRIRDSSETLIDIIFSNTLIENAIPGNSTAIISDHLPQFIILPNSFSNPLSNKSNIYDTETKYFFC